MNNPRDFLPAKYKSSSSSSSPILENEEPKLAPSTIEQKSMENMAAPAASADSPWADLAKEPTPTFSANNQFANEIVRPLTPADTVPSSAAPLKATEENANTSMSSSIPASFKPKKKNNAKLAGLLVLAFLAVGIVSSFVLLGQNQDNRQQASGGEVPYFLLPAGGGGCGMPGYRVELGPDGEQYCVPDDYRTMPFTGECGSGYEEVNVAGTAMCAPTSTAPPTGTASCEGCYGTCWGNSANSTDGGSSGGVVGGAGTSTQCPAGAWDDPNALIAGTYWHCTPGTNVCGRYTLNIPSTLNAAVLYFANNPELAEHLLTQEIPVMLQANNGNPIQLELAPFLSCGGTTDGYNTLASSSCVAGNGICAWTDEVTFFVDLPNGTTTQQTQTRCYLTGSYYTENYVDEGLTWSPYNTGCGDGVHDYPGQTGGSSAGTDPSYAGDCNTWHFTTCLNQGSGVNGLGCDINTPNNPGEGEPGEPGEPTGTSTPPPTGTPTGTATPTLPPQLVCAGIEMLDSAGNVMTEDDDEDLVDGDRVRFRGSARNTTPDRTPRFEFRILPPNTYAWINLTDTSAAAAPDVSAFYTIISSGHHVVQSRVCIDGTCQQWESNDDSNVNPGFSENIGAYCQALPGVASDRVKRICQQSSDCPADYYCNTGITCDADSDCEGEYVCYQPPMPECPEGAACKQMMPAKVCADPAQTAAFCTTDSDCSTGEVCYQPPMPTCAAGRECAQRMPAKICQAQ